MLKSKIARKLSLNFTLALLIFSFIISGVFLVLFRNYTIELHKKELQNYAQSLAGILSGESGHGGKGMGGYGAYLRFIGEVSDTDVWLVDQNLELITGAMGHSSMSGGVHVADLPAAAAQMIEDVFQGKTTFSEGFSDILSVVTLTVGVPIQNEKGEVWGAVLLHSPVEGTGEAVARGFLILLVSILLALLAAVVLSVVLSYSFTRPLYKMKTTALRLAQGDYTAQSNVAQKDEIGELSEVLDLLAVRLNQASCQREKLDQLRRDFVANISHELRTPITVMRGSLEALCDKVVVDPDKLEEYHCQMLKEAKFLERLVGDLLDLSRLQNPDFVIDMSAINVCEVVSDAARSASKLAQSKNVVIHTQLEDHCAQIQGDYGRLRQMFLVVLDNAIKFSPQNTQVDIIVTQLQVMIRDYGPGIGEEHLPHIFDRFYKTHGEQNKSGTGLGLAIAKQIADRHNIVLSAANHDNGGAEFVFKLPTGKI